MLKEHLAHEKKEKDLICSLPRSLGSLFELFDSFVATVWLQLCSPVSWLSLIICINIYAYATQMFFAAPGKYNITYQVDNLLYIISLSICICINTK